MQDPRTVQVHQSLGQLIDHVLLMCFIEYAIADGTEKIALDVLEDQVQV